MNPLWIIGAFLLLGKKNTKSSNPGETKNPGNPASQDDYLDRL